MRRRALIAAPLALAAPALAQPRWPDRPLRLVVPFPAGGPTDIVARPFAQRLGEVLGQPVVVDNRGGAGGNVGAEAVARAAPDGNAMLLATVGVLAINPALYPRLPYNAATDLQALAVIAAAPIAVVANPGAGIRTVAELLAQARAQPGQLTYGSAGNGSPGHLAGAIFNRLTGAALTHVAYRGSAPATQDLIGGQIPIMFDPVQTQLPHIQAGRIQALAISGAARIPLLPEVPTLREAGVAGHETTAWWALALPAGVPAEIAGRIDEATRRIGSDAAWREQMTRLAIEPVLLRGEALIAFLAAERAQWGLAVRESGATPD